VSQGESQKAILLTRFGLTFHPRGQYRQIPWADIFKRGCQGAFILPHAGVSAPQPAVAPPNVSSWHKADIAEPPINARFGSKSGQHMLNASFSPFDPSRTSTLKPP
jgi:hypothetical protein